MLYFEFSGNLILKLTTVEVNFIFVAFLSIFVKQMDDTAGIIKVN